ncbi:MAG: hypothetical protein AB7N91_13400 [Candidatus Tectimicrobiota bacterium]
MDSPVERLVSPSLAELLDRLAIDQIKEVKDSPHAAHYAEEIHRIIHDLDVIFAEAGIACTARLIRLVIALAQINLHIWHTKEMMQSGPEHFQECMKLAHQLNGIRNQIKNRILEDTGLHEPFAKKTNTATDSLTGWTLSVLE